MLYLGPDSETLEFGLLETEMLDRPSLGCERASDPRCSRRSYYQEMVIRFNQALTFMWQKYVAKLQEIEEPCTGLIMPIRD